MQQETRNLQLESFKLEHARSKNFVWEVQDADNSDDDKPGPGRMPFAANVHTAARNNYFKKMQGLAKN